MGLPVSAADEPRDRSAHQQVDDCGDAPVDSDREVRVVEAEDAVQRSGQRVSPVVDLRDDAVARIRP